MSVRATVLRVPLVTLLLLGSVAAGGGQTSGGRTRDAPTIPSSVPESHRADYLRMIEVERELQSLQPLFKQVGLTILQDLKELEQRPEGRRDEWAEALRRRYASPSGIVG